MSHFFDWFLIGWVIISVIATPFVGRFLGNAHPEPEDVPANDNFAAARQERAGL